MNANTPTAIAREIFAGKDRSRKAAAALPIEEKLRRLVAMQQRANEIRRSANRPLMRVWELN
ncbi:MAG: hypothetical protein M9920_05650 [Verrucomicrobiae bacterium]|nr:hypothetical protein [Verrucomicrobiae bacterium]